MALGSRGFALAATLLALTLCGGSSRADEGVDDQIDPSDYIEMPAPTDGSYVLASPPGSGHNFGKPVFIRHLILVAREWHRRHPELPKLCIGDMSHRDASDFPPHVTHKDGLTADIVTRPVNICDINHSEPAHQIELAELFVAFGARQILFNGDAVVKKIKVAQKHDKHDDHFHVVVDPQKVPDEDKPVVAPGPDLGDKAVFGGADLDKEGKGLWLRWLLLGGTKDAPKSVRAVFAEGETELWDSGAVKPPREPALRLPVAVVDGKTYRWKLTIDLASGATAGFDWQTIRADLAPPSLVLLGPDDGAALSSAPELAWKLEKPGVEQAGFAVELAETLNGKPFLTVGPIESAKGAFALRATPLRKGRHTYWRLRARDSHGNLAVSEWRSWKTADGYRFVPPTGTLKRAGELKGANDALVAKLKKGEEVLVLGEGDTRLHVQAAKGEGFLPRSAVELK